MYDTPIIASEIAVAYVTTFLPKSLQNKIIESYEQEFIYSNKLLDIESGYYKEVMNLLETTRLDECKRNQNKVIIISIIATLISIIPTIMYPHMWYVSLIALSVLAGMFWLNSFILERQLKRALIKDAVAFNYVLKDIESVINYRNVEHFNEEIMPLLNEYDKQKERIRRNNTKISHYDRLLYLVRRKAFSIYIEHMEDIDSTKKRHDLMLLNTPYNVS